MEFLILILIALIISSIGYYKYIYFISLGYGFSVVGLGAAMLIMFRNDLKIDTIVMCVLFIVYGFRLGGYLLLREIKSASYRNTMKKEIKDGKDMKFIAKFFIWVSCAALYAMQVSPVLFRMKHGKGTDVVGIVGCVCIVYIMFGGARRLEIRQNRNYGSDPEYQEYVKKTPILIPLIPLYSVEKYKFLVG